MCNLRGAAVFPVALFQVLAKSLRAGEPFDDPFNVVRTDAVVVSFTGVVCTSPIRTSWTAFLVQAATVAPAPGEVVEIVDHGYVPKPTYPWSSRG